MSDRPALTHIRFHFDDASIVEIPVDHVRLVSWFFQHGWVEPSRFEITLSLDAQLQDWLAVEKGKLVRK